ncbi:MAG TPA: 4-alpha-glucanotransferase [Acetobacteraceae bacterium]|nr:4-alpha-glucanotransferase [Acetobacteraceae bacterium]
MTDEAIRYLARGAGIAVEWNDYAGRSKTVAPDVLRHMLEALGLPCTTHGDVLASRTLLQHGSCLQVLPPLITATSGRSIPLGVRASEPHGARLSLESGGVHDVVLAPAHGRPCVPAVRAPGYHLLLIDDREFVLAVAPARCHTLNDAMPDALLWGIAAQVYSLRRRGDGGIRDAAEAAGSRGADALALSPLHALFGADPSRYGPYSPSTRLVLNPLHASAALVFNVAHVPHILRAEGLDQTCERLERQPLIDWPAAAHAKHRLLRALFDLFIDTDAPLHLDFASFRADEGELLAQHAVFETLHAVKSAAGEGDWHCRPMDLREPGSAAVAVSAASHEREVPFHCVLQWLADRSLGIAQRRARAAARQPRVEPEHDVLGGLSISAPPDMFNPLGQDWKVIGFSPRALTAGGFSPFLATLRAALHNAGGARIVGIGVNEADVTAERATDRDALWQAFVEAGAANGDAPPPHDTAPVVDASLAFVADTPSPFCLPPVEYLLGVEEQPNLPGTVNEHSNRRRHLPVDVDVDSLLDQPRTAARVKHLAARRPRL